MTGKKVTAIVSAYYAEEFLEGRIENLLSQSIMPEIVCVFQKDSKEAEILGKFGDKVRRICTDGIPTLYEAWNMAIEESTGEYLVSANCDDRFYPRALEKLARILDQQPGFAMSYFDVDIVEEIDGAPVKTFHWAEGGIEYLVKKGCFLGPMPMWRRSLHQKYGMFEAECKLRNGETYKPQIVSDYEFWMRLANGGEKFFHIKETLGAYLAREGNLEHRAPLRRIWEDARARSKYRQQFEVMP